MARHLPGLRAGANMSISSNMGRTEAATASPSTGSNPVTQALSAQVPTGSDQDVVGLWFLLLVEAGALVLLRRLAPNRHGG